MAVRKGITKKKKEKGADDGPKELTSEELGGLDPKVVEDFMRGRITLGELQGFDKGSQGKVATIGLEYLENGKFIEAENVFTGLLAMDPYEPFYFEALGSICQRREDWPNAEAWYSRALEAAAEKNTRSATARANRGEVRLMMGRLEDAVDDLTQAIVEDPDFKEPTTERARRLLAEVNRQIEEAQN